MGFLSNGRTTIADIKHINLIGKEGLGIYQLILQMELLIKSQNEFEAVLRNLSAEIVVVSSEGKELLLGVATPERPYLENTREKHDLQSISNLRLLLSHHQLELIEEIRKGNDFEIKSKIYCEFYSTYIDGRHDNNSSGSVEIIRNVNQSEWISVLESMDYGKYLLLEIPFPELSNSKIPQNILNEITSAQEHFIKGHYEVTITKSRLSLELLSNLLNDSNLISKSFGLFKGSKSERESMSKEERFYAIRKAILHYNHLSVHSEEDGNVANFNRIEAQQILSMTISCLTYYLTAYDSV